MIYIFIGIYRLILTILTTITCIVAALFQMMWSFKLPERRWYGIIFGNFDGISQYYANPIDCLIDRPTYILLGYQESMGRSYFERQFTVYIKPPKGITPNASNLYTHLAVYKSKL